MCIFNTAIREVGGTKILAARLDDGRQVVVYRNYVQAEFDTARVGRSDANKLAAAQNALEKREQKNGPTPAMILPFPCADKGAGTKVELVGLHENKTLFADLALCFPTVRRVKNEEKKSRRKANFLAHEKLEVHKVGSYNVRFVEIACRVVLSENP